MYHDFEVKIHKSANGTFQTKFINPKTAKRKRKRFNTLKEAREYKRQMELKILDKGLYIFNDLRVSQAMKEYLEKITDKQIKSRKNHFESFIKNFGNYKVSKITSTDLKLWMERSKKKGRLSNRTLGHIKSQFNGFFKYLKKEKYLKENPMNDVHFKSTDSPRRKRVVLSVNEVRNLLENAKRFSPKILYPYLACVVHTGARKSEILKLSRNDVDFNTGLIHLRETKNNQERFVKISPLLKEVLIKQISSHEKESLFLNEKKERLHRSQLGRLIAKFKAFFPIEGKDWGLHSLRHSFAYNFLKNEGRMYQLQAILGHKSITMTVNLYGQLQAQDIECPSPYEY